MSLKARLPVLLLPMLLSACVLEDESSLVNVQWPEQRVVFVADTRTGTVSAVTRNEIGQPQAVADGSLPASTRNMVLDKEHKHLWVLGANGIDVLDANSLELQKHIALNTAATPSVLKQDKSGISLYSVTGALLGRIDVHTLAVSWRGRGDAITIARQG